MSTIVPMPVRVNPPPADIGETISPSCAALTVTMPANGARTTVSSRLRSASASRASATSTARAGDFELRPRRVVARLRGVERLRADDGARELLLVALERGLRIRERDLGGNEIRSALLELGARLRDAGPRVRVVEARNDLVALDALAFLDADGHDLTRDLGGNRRLAARDDIAGRVEDRARPDGGCVRNRLRDGDLNRHCARQPNDRAPRATTRTATANDAPHHHAVRRRGGSGARSIRSCSINEA